jgi:hypothetical protein
MFDIFKELKIYGFLRHNVPLIYISGFFIRTDAVGRQQYTGSKSER